MQVQQKTDSLIARELEESERVLWMGRPVANRRATAPVTLTFMILTAVFGAIGLIMLILAIIFTTLLHTRGGADASLALYITGAVFLFMALIYGILAATIRPNLRGTVYAITDQRILSISAGKTLIVYSFTRNTIGVISRIERTDGSEDLTFAVPNRAGSDGYNNYGGYGNYGGYSGYGGGGYSVRNLAIAANAGKFINISDVREVERIVRRTFKEI